MSPEFGRLKEPEEPGKGGCKQLNTWEGYRGKAHTRTHTLGRPTRQCLHTQIQLRQRDTHWGKTPREASNYGVWRKERSGRQRNKQKRGSFHECGEHKWNEKHMTQGRQFYMRLGRLSSQSFHITYSQSNVGKEVSHGKWQKDNKKLMKRPVPVNMLVKRVFLLSAESSWNSSSFIWNPGCKKKGPLHKLTKSRCRSKLSITLPNTPDVLHFNMNFK